MRGVLRKQTTEDHGLGRLEARQRFRHALLLVGNRIAHARVRDLLDLGSDKTDLARAELAQDLADREAAVDSREKAFNERVKAFENRRVNLVQNAKYLVGMPPANARDILVKMEDQDVIDIFAYNVDTNISRLAIG